jgi:flagellar motor switch/type III secretory pathway protein FliN
MPAKDDPVIVMAHDRPVAKGEIMIHGDKIGVSIYGAAERSPEITQ